MPQHLTRIIAVVDLPDPTLLEVGYPVIHNGIIKTVNATQTGWNENQWGPAQHDAHPHVHTHSKAINLKTVADASFTPALVDAYCYVRLTNAATVAVTVPNNSAVAFELGTVIHLRAAGAGGFSFVGDSGVTVESVGNTVNQHGTVALVKTAMNAWDATGSLT